MLQPIKKDIEWKCEMCKRMRPDDSISVMTIYLNSGMERNVKFCNDCPQCRERVVEFADEERERTRQMLQHKQYTVSSIGKNPF